MRKFLMALCMFMILAASYGNASVFVTLSQQEFDGLVENILYHLSSDETLMVLEKTANGAYHYTLHKDGFYFYSYLSGNKKKTFASSRVNVVPVVAVEVGTERRF